MIIDGTFFTCEMEDVLTELQSQLIINHYPYLQKGFKRSGDSLQVQCPFHGNGQERHPSYGIRRSDGIGHCFACGCVHTLPEFIGACFEKNDITGSFGRHWLHKNFMSLEVEERQDIKLDLSRTHMQESISSKYVTEEELDSYRYTHPYWKSRGIIDEDVIDLFDLGYDPKSKSITFPVRDIDGNCLFVAKRSVKTKFFHYPEGVQKPLYGLYELYYKFYTKYKWRYEVLDSSLVDSTGYKVTGTMNFAENIFVTESMIDCILLWQAGYYAVALNGLGNSLQMKQLRQLPCRIYILATDNDEAGKKARQKIRENVHNKLFMEIIFPKGIKDIGECTQEQLKNILQWEQI